MEKDRSATIPYNLETGEVSSVIEYLKRNTFFLDHPDREKTRIFIYDSLSGNFICGVVNLVKNYDEKKDDREGFQVKVGEKPCLEVIPHSRLEKVLDEYIKAQKSRPHVSADFPSEMTSQ